VSLFVEIFFFPHGDTFMAYLAILRAPLSPATNYASANIPIFPLESSSCWLKQLAIREAYCQNGTASASRGLVISQTKKPLSNLVERTRTKQNGQGEDK
jgi:hypothetical protein